ncbi:DNA polymerase III subunit delta' [Pelagibius sp. Alg239-R121]|uniref:DNA polymerase III subunit delta' n=1 Tax=Pelagibius sp. Alg239-R121 TaxID=2993448 RepID=UPI0024A749AB|nr:DNA polymerase III subunit delta' [Pelagibius sp. Alg239-R121]
MAKAAVEIETTAPRENADLLGHGAAEKRLLTAYESGRLPHAWLMTGPRGVGKATLAFRFARFVLNGGTSAPGLFGGSPDGLSLDPGNEVFRRVASGGHGDLMTVERGVDQKGKVRSVIPVEDARNVVSFLRRTSTEGGWRIVIVDSIDDMNINATNALLKILEEPPKDVLLLLISHQPARLLPTIHSRCCHLPLTPLGEESLLTLLQQHRPKLDPLEAQALARLSEGSIGRALQLDAIGGLELYKALMDIVAHIPGMDIVKVQAFSDRLAQDSGGDTFRTGMELLLWWLARMINGGARQQLPPPVVAGETDIMESLLARRPLAQWLTLWDKTSALYNSADRANLDRKHVVISVFSEIEALTS